MRKIVLLAFITSALFSSCQKNNLAPGSKNALGGIGAKNSALLTTDVYILGTYNQDGAVSSAYLKNGSLVTLPSPPLGGETFDIAVSGSNVYVAGSAATSSGVFQAFYYKNDTIHYLNYSTVKHFASEGFAIAANGNDVYVVGDYYDLDRQLVYAMLWKNEVPQNLSYNKYPSGARAVAVDHGIVYVAGYSELDASRTTIATFWKNGAHGRVKATLPNSDAAGLYFNNRGDFYISGTTFNDPTAPTGVYWFDSVVQMDVPAATGTNPPVPYLKNGVITYAPGIGNAFERDLKFIGNDVYIVGQNQDTGAGVFYKNGAQVPLPAGFTPQKICLVQH